MAETNRNPNEVLEDLENLLEEEGDFKVTCQELQDDTWRVRIDMEKQVDYTQEEDDEEEKQEEEEKKAEDEDMAESQKEIKKLALAFEIAADSEGLKFLTCERLSGDFFFYKEVWDIVRNQLFLLE